VFLRARTASSFFTSHSEDPEREMVSREPTGHHNQLPGLMYLSTGWQMQCVPHFTPHPGLTPRVWMAAP